MHSTNYYNTFIEIAEDSPTDTAELPPQKGEKKSVANWQFEKLYDRPYELSSDDVLFEVHAIRKGLSPGELDEHRAAYFSKGQPCFRASPLTKRYGWGVHYNAEGKMAIYPAESQEYQQFLADDSVKKLKAMKSKR